MGEYDYAEDINQESKRAEKESVEDLEKASP
jgi:hypothetical protein